MSDLTPEKVQTELTVAVREGRLFSGTGAIACPGDSSGSVSVVFPSGQRLVIYYIDSVCRGVRVYEAFRRQVAGDGS